MTTQTEGKRNVRPLTVPMHECDICKRRFAWGETPEAEWFGSIKDVDAGRRDSIIVVCSAECKRRHLDAVAHRKDHP